MIERFFIHTVTVMTPVEGVEDVYGNTSKADPDNGTDYKARVSPLDTEELRLYDDATVTRKKLRLPAGAVIGSDSTILWDGKTFQVEGEPEPIDRTRSGPSHLRAVIRRVEGG